MAPPRPQDLSAGFMGLIAAVLFIGAIVYGTVVFTNSYMASKGAHSAQTTH